MKKVTFLIMSLILCSAGYSMPDSAYISVRERILKDAVLLRWAPSSPSAWQAVNKYGVDIERYTMVRDGKILLQPELNKLNVEPLKPAPLNEWATIVQTSDYAAIIAQALYGEDFEISTGDENSLARITGKSQEVEQRFAISLYAADRDFEAACFAGWGLIDRQVKPDERYLYRVVAKMPDGNRFPIETGAAFAAMDEYEPLPTPVGLTGIFGDKNILLAWDYAILADTYNAYFIEKSTDGQLFVRLDGVPVVNMNSRDGEAADVMYFTDSLSDNYTKYWYRIRGITAFGETGPPSESVSGQGKTTFVFVPYLTRSEFDIQGNVQLQWDFDRTADSLITGFELLLSENSENGFTVVEKNIAPESRTLLFPKERLYPSNYFIIRALPYSSAPTESFPVLVQPIDSIPPAIPVGLTGAIDSLGTVTLQWRRNSEPDLLGYKVFRSFTSDAELTPLFDLAMPDSTFRDTVEVNNLNSSVYYAVAALDSRYNQSDVTALIKIDKPRLITPSPPVISNCKIVDEGIELQWINSPDSTVLLHRLLRREKNEGYLSSSILANIYDRQTNVYVDTSALSGVTYIYTLTAVTKDGISASSNAVSAVRKGATSQTTGILRFDAVLDKTNRLLKLQWRDKLPDVHHYDIYKSAGDGMALWKSIPACVYEIFDGDLSANTEYRYLLQAILKSGKNTESKSLIFKY